MKCKPTRRDLLIVIEQLQHLVGQAKAAAENDRNPNRLVDTQTPLTKAFNLALAARSFDPPLDEIKSPWRVE